MDILVSPDFVKHVKKAIVSIVFFAFCFLIMICIGLGAAFALGYAGIFIITLKPIFFILILGAGLILSALMIVAFLFKFMFQKSVSPIEGMKEISRSQHPRLFMMIDDIVKEVGTDFPKRIFISSQLNASVFYNSSFWSMFLPVRKNLHIGLGLVNASTEQELKGILAHEFGHFSQRSMKVGSYVYNVNRIIYNLLYENNSFDAFMGKVGSSHYLMQLTVFIARLIIKGFQGILKALYGYLNTSYMALSREMEFHADAVAAQIVGSRTLIASLSRMDLADNAYSSTFGFLNKQYGLDYKILNFFTLNAFVLSYYGKINKMEFKGRFPIVSAEELNKYNKSRLNIKDQWASHPTMEERIAKIEKLNIPGKEEDLAEAFELFNHKETLQEKLTEDLYPLDEKAGFSMRSDEDADTAFLAYYESLTFNKEYNGYYDLRNPPVKVPEVMETDEVVSLDILYSDAVLAELSILYAHKNDVESLKFIVTDKQHSVKTFDFEGKKYSRKQAADLLPLLEKDKQKLEAEFEKHDALIYSFFKKRAVESGCVDRFETLYTKFVRMDELYEKAAGLVNDLNVQLAFLNRETPNDQIQRNFKEVQKNEELWKLHIKNLMELPLYVEKTETVYKGILKNYYDNDQPYFYAEAYNIAALNLLMDALNCSYQVHSDLIFHAKKELLDFQVTMAESTAVHH